MLLHSLLLTLLPIVSTLEPPTLTNVSPGVAIQGGNVTVTLTGTSFTSPLSVDAGPDITVSSVNVSSPTLATATLSLNVNVAVGPRDLFVITDSGDSNAVAFTVLPIPDKPCPAVTTEGNLPAAFPFYTTIPGSDFMPGDIVRITATGCIGIDSVGGVASPEGSWRVTSGALSLTDEAPPDSLLCRVGTDAPTSAGKELIAIAIDSGVVTCVVNKGHPSAILTGAWNVSATVVTGQQPCSDITPSGNVPASSPTFTNVAGLTVSRPHQRIRIEASGCVHVDSNGNASPSGSWRTKAGPGAVRPGQPLHGLVCRIGAGFPFYVGSSLVHEAGGETGTVSCILNEVSTSPDAFADNIGSWTVSVTNLDGNNEFIVNFGESAGTWTWSSNDGWAKFHDLPAKHMLTVDLDDNGKPEVVVDFGPSDGIWILFNNSQWVQLHVLSSQGIVAAELTGTKHYDLIIDFGAPYGIYIWRNNSRWVRLHSLSGRHMAVGNLDGIFPPDIVIDFGSPFGLWIWRNNTDWVSLHALQANLIQTADLDGNRRDDIIVDFGAPHGIWIRYDSGVWAKLHEQGALNMVAADIDGSGKADVVLDFGPSDGVWIWKNDSTWTKLHNLSVQRMTSGDLDGNGSAELIFDFGVPLGIWTYLNDREWIFLNPSSTQQVWTGDIDKN
jgi:hypothetical protein